VLRGRETHRAGIESVCITIDRDARDYLPHMYGSARWTLVDDVSRLPLKVADIYCHLTA
jgi:nitric oxide reductase NorD protein